MCSLSFSQTTREWYGLLTIDSAKVPHLNLRAHNKNPLHDAGDFFGAVGDPPERLMSFSRAGTRQPEADPPWAETLIAFSCGQGGTLLWTWDFSRDEKSLLVPLESKAVCFLLWARRDSNPQSFRNQFLRLARIPIPPPAQYTIYIIFAFSPKILRRCAASSATAGESSYSP